MDERTAYRRRWGGLAVLVLCLLVVVADNTILNVALRTLSDPEKGLGATQAQLAWAINSYTLVFAGLLFTFGVLGDRWGRRRMLAAGLVVFGTASALSACSQTPGQLVLARAAMGLGAAMVMPQTLSTIAQVFPERERGRAIGLWSGAVGLAMALGPSAGGLLLETFWWGSIFLVNVPIALTALVLAFLLLPESRDPDPGRPDVAGVLLSVPGLVLLVYGIITAGERSSPAGGDVLGALAGGVLAIVLFLVHEARTPNPSLDLRFFREPRFSVSVACVVLMFFSMSGLVFFLSFYWQSVRGFAPLAAGLLVVPAAVGQMTLAPLSPALVHRYGQRAVAGTGAFVVALSVSFLVLLRTDTPVWLVLVLLFAHSAAMTVVITPSTDAIVSTVPAERAGAASALQNTVRQVATALGVAVVGAVISSRYRAGITPALEEAARQEGAEHLDGSDLHAAGESVEGTLALARALGERGRMLVAPAKEAFMEGVHIAAAVSAACALVALAVVLLWLPKGGGARRARPTLRECA